MTQELTDLNERQGTNKIITHLKTPRLESPATRSQKTPTGAEDVGCSRSADGAPPVQDEKSTVQRKKIQNRQEIFKKNKQRKIKNEFAKENF